MANRAIITWSEIEFTNEGADELIIPVTVVLGQNTEISRDIRITSSVATNTTRDIRISGIPGNEVSRDIRISGPVSNQASVAHDIRITGNLGRRATVTWAEISFPANTNIVLRDIRITGQQTSSAARDIRIGGQIGTASNVTRDLRITGGLPWVGLTVTYKSTVLTENVVRDIRITGQAATNVTNDLRIVGQISSNSPRDIRITGQLSSNNTRDIRISGTQTSNVIRDLRITGKADSSRVTDIRVTGQLLSNVNRDVRITGTATTTFNRDLRIVGTATTNTNRDIRIAGQLGSDVNRDIRITGFAAANTTRDLRIDSIGITDTTRDLRLTGRGGDDVIRDLRTFGEILVQVDSDIRIRGSIASSTDRDLRIFGVEATNVTRDIHLVGGVETFTSTSRDIRISGRPVQVARPDGVISAGGWVAVPSGTLASTIDEVVPDESDYMKSTTNTVEIAELTLSNVTAPLVDDNHILRYRIAAKTTPSPMELTVALLQGATTIASWVHNTLGSQPQTFERVLTTGQAAAITDYNDLRLKFTSVPPIVSDVEFDSSTSATRTTTTDPFTFTHTPTNTLAGVALLASHGNTTTDKWGTVTYGGVTMTRVDTSSTSSGGSGNNGLSAIWVLLSDVPQGAQTVSIDYTSFDDDDCLYTLVGIVSDYDLEVIDNDKITDINGADPALSMQSSGRHSITLATLLSATNVTTNFTPNAGTTKYAEFDGGSYCVWNLGQTTPGTSNFTIGGTLTADWHCMVAVTLAQVVI